MLASGRVRTRAIGIALGFAADALLGDPKRHHPVAWFGSWAVAVESTTYADDSTRGALFTAGAVAPVLTLGVVAERASRRHPLLHIAATALTTWAVLGARSLSREGEAVASHLDADDLPAAREQITHLCGRDPDQLDAAEVARAAVESMAENTADAAVASLFWGAIAGIPGMVLHRATATPATAGSAPRRPGSTTPSTTCPPVPPGCWPRLWPRW